MRPRTSYAITLAFIFLAVGCSKHLSSFHIHQKKPPQPQDITENIQVQDPYIVFLKKTLPRIPQGMSYDQVCSVLKLDLAFNGLIFSGGSRNKFDYTFELGKHKLILSFDYTASRVGKFIAYRFISLS